MNIAKLLRIPKRKFFHRTHAVGASVCKRDILKKTIENPQE